MWQFLSRSAVFYLWMLFFLLQACGRYTHDSARDSDSLLALKPLYAKGFLIQKGDGFSILTVKNPWQGAQNAARQYVTASDPRLVPIHLRNLPFIQVPVHKLVCLSTTQLSMLVALGEEQAITGISGARFVYNPVLRERIAMNLIHEVGYEQGLDIELLLSLNPDLVLTYGVGSEITGTVGKLKELGITSVFDSEYLEDHPLAKAEWIKYLAVLFGKEKLADSIFGSLSERYASYAALLQNVELRPAVMTGLPWKDSWNVPPAKSTTARFIEDAGGMYVWRDLHGAQNFSLSLEKVIATGDMAEIWINTGIARSLGEITASEERLSELRPLKTGKVFNNNYRLGPEGGNDFWESGVLNPDLILADLISIFHPELLPDHPLYYYVKLQ